MLSTAVEVSTNGFVSIEEGDTRAWTSRGRFQE